MLFLAHTCLLVDERERETRSYIPKGWFFGFLSLSLSRAREEEEDQAKDRRGPRRTPPDGCVVVVVVVVLSTDRPKGKEKERKREMPRRPEKKIVVVVAKGMLCWRENRRIQKGLHRINVSFLPAIEKEENTRDLFSSTHLAVLLSHTSEKKTKTKTKTCRSLSLFLSVSKHFRQKRRSFKPSRRLCRRPKKTKKARDIFFKHI